MSERKTILLVDSFIDERDMYAEFLRFSGFELAVCYAPEDVRRMATEYGASAVVTRVRQPGAVDGIELTRQIKADESTRHIPVVIITTYTEPTVRSLAHEAGCDSFLVLPCLPDGLAAALQDLVGRAPATAQALERHDQ